jgi:SAM-dependent methyltransferase
VSESGSAAAGANADRFSGFAGLYDRVRPTPPAALADLLCRYAGVSRPSLVVDLGSGTGLSSRWCELWADRVIGVEPSDDMRERAAEATATDLAISYRPGWSTDTGLESGVADIVLAVQALHWMEPDGTLAEVARILRPGGVFAAVDADWPPAVGDADVEAGWDRCLVLAQGYEDRLAAGDDAEALHAPLPPEVTQPLLAQPGRDLHCDRTHALGVQSWSKSGHLGRMAASGRFRWCREVALHAATEGDAGRFVDLLRSQGGIQTLLKRGFSEDELGVTDLARIAAERLGHSPRPWWFTYRIRLAVT